MLFEVDWTGARGVRFSEKFLEALSRLCVKHIPSAKGKRATVSFVSSLKIRNLNRAYRGIDRATDVLSFSALDGEFMPGTEREFVGDILLCLPYIRASAKEQNAPLSEELVRMFVHGLMHCLGYDHMKPREAKRMLPLQEEVISLAMKQYDA